MMDAPENAVPPMMVDKGQACFHCYKERSSSPLQRCSGCFHVYYCGSECQKANWPRHKAICKAFKAVETNNGRALYAPFLSRDEDEETYVCKNLEKLYTCLDLVHNVHLKLLERKLGRSLDVDERNIIGHEPRCLACGRSDSIFRIESALGERGPRSQGLKSCPECCTSFYCSDEHWQAVKDRHQHTPCQDGRDNLSQCAMNKLWVEDVRFGWYMQNASGKMFKWAPERTLQSWSSLRGLEWTAFEPEVEKTFGGIPQLRILLGAIARRATEGLTMPMTILWALENLNSDDAWTKQDTLNIHVLGPAEKEIMYADVLEEILHRLPLVKTLKVTLCGPELEEIMGGKIFGTIEMGTCPQCTLSGRKRVFSYVAKPYHEYIWSQGTSFALPDLAIAFNSGCSQEYVDSWKTTIDILKARHIPTVFTAYNQEEAEDEAKILEAAGATLHPELGPRRNIWGSQLSKAEPNKVTGFFSVNGWLAGGFR